MSQNPTINAPRESDTTWAVSNKQYEHFATIQLKTNWESIMNIIIAIGLAYTIFIQ